jgi:hypothetical protein
MASISKSNQDTDTSRGSTGGESIGSPISNEAYDVLTALHSKLEGLEAYRKFAKDGNDGLWRELTKSDVECVERLVGELERMVKGGTLRMKTPGKAS